MCIIAVKNRGVAMPSEDTIRTMFQRNPDGAGFMLRQKGTDEILLRKGFMKIGEFLKAVKKLKVKKDDIFIMHFRIQTSGGVTKGLCHPFVISDDDKLLRETTLTTKRICFAHNGVIIQLSHTNSEAECSDTSLFARDYLSDDAIYYNIFNSVAVQSFIEDFIGSHRKVFLHPDDDEAPLMMIGSWNNGDGGMKYSNGTYKHYEYMGLDDWDDGVIGFNYSGVGGGNTNSRVGGGKSVHNNSAVEARDYTNKDSYYKQSTNVNDLTTQCDYCKEWDICTWVRGAHAWVCPTCMPDNKSKEIVVVNPNTEPEEVSGSTVSIKREGGFVYTRKYINGKEVSLSVTTDKGEVVTPPDEAKSATPDEVTSLVVVEDEDGDTRYVKPPEGLREPTPSIPYASIIQKLNMKKVKEIREKYDMDGSKPKKSDA